MYRSTLICSGQCLHSNIVSFIKDISETPVWAKHNKQNMMQTELCGPAFTSEDSSVALVIGIVSFTIWGKCKCI